VVSGIALAYVAQVTLQSSFGPNAPFELGAFVIPMAEGAPWRLFSYALVHAGLIHAGMNAWVMWDVGRLLERRSGPASVAGSFVFGTVGGSLLSAALMDDGGLVGASGGVLGVGGALLVNAYLRSAKEGTQLFRGVGTWLIIIMAFSVMFPRVSIWGHLGGIVAGAAFGFVFDRTRSRVVDVGVLVASVAVFGWTVYEMAALAGRMGLV
jgi:membrane associated rhomboid family serine protease